MCESLLSKAVTYCFPMGSAHGYSLSWLAPTLSCSLLHPSLDFTWYDLTCRVNSLVPSESSSNISKLSVILVDEEDLDSNDVWEEQYCREVEP